eukprot:TRINITY_DN2559_c0_g1_i1.p1 TRINITY_DN2559_c0_g1~~TRINITY_DN2559_c0_g1_i1.p1  ORF type:complete len:249 (+),score=101.13 TRINITY_DN2559_c0_g1_i1:301-1047(+)
MEEVQKNNSSGGGTSIGSISQLGGFNSSQQFTFSLETPSLSSGTLDKYLKSVLGSDSSNAIPDLLKPLPDTNSSTNVNDSIPPSSFTKTESTRVTLQAAPHPPPQQQQQQQQHQHQINNSLVSNHSSESQVNNQQLALSTTHENGELMNVARGQAYVDITEYLNMPQSDAAKKLGIPPSTLSKRWKEAVRKRKWPYRMICKIDKEIMTLLHNVPQGPNAPPLPEEIEAALGTLLRRRQEELRPVVIRI